MGYWEDYEERNDYEEKQKIYNCYNPEKDKKNPSKSSRVKRRNYLKEKYEKENSVQH